MVCSWLGEIFAQVVSRSHVLSKWCLLSAVCLPLLCVSHLWTASPQTSKGGSEPNNLFSLPLSATRGVMVYFPGRGVRI